MLVHRPESGLRSGKSKRHDSCFERRTRARTSRFPRNADKTRLNCEGLAMRIGIVGGLDRAEPRFHRAAELAGHEIVLHNGKVHGRGIRALEQLVETCDLVLIVTEENSHGAVQLTRKLLRLNGREPVLMRKCGIGRFTALLDEWSNAPVAVAA
jgi:hypothetical protein